MTILICIAALIECARRFTRDWHLGRALLTWSRRCDPMNPSFKPPHLPGTRAKD
jgi:hypothetical protein